MASWFSGIMGQQPKKEETTFGYNIDKKNTVSEMHNMKTKMVKTTSNYIGELSKYKEIAKFNKQLSKSYIANLDIIVDVSKVLNMYMETFEVVRSQIERAEQALGKKLDAEDLGYLSEITKENIAALSKNFMTETEKLRLLFGKNPEYSRETAKLVNSQTEFKNSIAQWGETYGKEKAILTAEAQQQQPVAAPPPAALRFGGKSKKPRKPRKRT
jgi:hypothetical protein